MGLENILSHLEVGKDLYGIQDIDSQGQSVGTLWWTFYSLPVAPIATYHVQLFHPEHDTLKYKLLDKKPLDYHSVARTYLNTVFVVILFLAPLGLFVTPIKDWFTISELALIGVVIGAMVWSVGVVVAAAKFHVRSGTPHMLPKPPDPTEQGLGQRILIIVWIFLMAVLAGVFILTNTGPFPLLVRIQLLLGFFSFELTFALLMAIETLVSIALYSGYRWLGAKIRGQ